MTLSEAAYQLGEEIRDGRLKHVADLASKPAPDCDELIRQFERRCPGYSRREYQTALATGLFESR